MRHIELSEFRDEDGQITLENRIKASLRHGLRWYNEMQAQDLAIEKLSRTLGPEHVAITNLMLAGTSIAIPMIILSPQGILVALPSALSGVFRAKGDDWLKYGGGGSQRFTPARPNILGEISALAELVQSYLRDKGYDIQEVEPVIIFTNPRTHIDTQTPSVRIVQADAIDRFAAKLLENQPIMDQDDIRDLTTLLTRPPAPPVEEKPEPVPEAKPRPVAPIDLPEPSTLEQQAFYAGDSSALTPRKQRSLGGRRLPFSRRQTILLAVMVFFEILVLAVMIMVVLANTVYA
jgi:hypothetical protein